MTVVDASRPNLKLAPGTYAASPAFSGSFTLTAYGPATTSGFNVGGNGGTLRLRDIDAGPPGGNGVICRATASNLAKPKLDLRRVTTGYLDFEFCDGTVTNVTVNGLDSSTNQTALSAVDVAGSGGTGGSTVTFTSVLINRGDPGISVADASSVSFVNSVFSNQGTYVGFVGVALTASARFDFTTFYNSYVKCLNNNTVLATFTNSIFLNSASGAPANTVTGTGCTYSYDMLKPQSAMPAGANNLLNMDPRFVNAGSGDFHLMIGSPAIDAADPGSTVSTDYDSVMRPQGAGRDLGAFEYKP
jgi:hypothetical protein